MARIAVAGLQYKTNTFAPFPTTYEMFQIPGTWPAMVDLGSRRLANIIQHTVPLQ